MEDSNLEKELKIPVLAKFESARAHLPGKVNFEPFKDSDKAEIANLLSAKPDELAEIVLESDKLMDLQEGELRVEEFGSEWQSFAESGFMSIAQDNYNLGEGSFDEEFLSAISAPSLD
ncbi:MAG: hypothetical protein HRT47_12655 [Candidatus Caenarcaniphilales bacterium]|nr:hypothetical protein [Candidatus Caenarcaniphilales bacterium]